MESRKMMETGLVLAALKGRVSGYVEDQLPVTIAVADPRKTAMGISIQQGYPLEMIERSYGIPFGRMRRDAVKMISDPDELHACKWSMDLHAAVFGVEAANDLRLQGDQKRLAVALSTGLGNVLQNRRSVAFLDGALHHVVGETPDHLPPYACLVGYTPGSPAWEQRVGVEMLLFSGDGSVEGIDKTDYVNAPLVAVAPDRSKANVQGNIRWAVSGYPLILDGQRVSFEETAAHVHDYRHLWSLPRLQKSVIQHLARVSIIPNAEKRIEFYFGVEELCGRASFVRAANGQPVTFPLDLPVTVEWLQTVSSVCRISSERLLSCPAFEKSHHRLRLAPSEVAEDFSTSRYVARERLQQVQQPGDFHIDPARQEITVCFLPAVYPHHVVGITPEGAVVNISIAGLSGRSGITIESAKDLCQDIGLTDALIFDNGNDVVARLGAPGMTIAHKQNRRQTRLTACLHFACAVESDAGIASMDGIEILCTSCHVHARHESL